MKALYLLLHCQEKLCVDSLVNRSVIVRSTYQRYNSKCKVYSEGIDYTVDYNKGEITRTINSTIPDYSKHILYGLKDFGPHKNSLMSLIILFLSG